MCPILGVAAVFVGYASVHDCRVVQTSPFAQSNWLVVPYSKGSTVCLIFAGTVLAYYIFKITTAWQTYLVSFLSFIYKQSITTFCVSFSVSFKNCTST